MLISIDQSGPEADLQDLVLFEIEIDSEKAWESASNIINTVLKENGVEGEWNSEELDMKSDGKLTEAIQATVEYYQGIYPNEAIPTGWTDIYDGEPKEGLEEEVKKAVEESNTLEDVINILRRKYDRVKILFDEYNDNGDYLLKEAIRNIKSGKYGNKKAQAKWPQEIDFTFYEGESLYYGKDTVEYQMLDMIPEEDWQLYLDDMASAGITVEYDNVVDAYIVRSSGAGKESNKTLGKIVGEEDRWVYGTKDEKWYLVGPEDRDYERGISQQEFKELGEEEAKEKYLSPKKIGEEESIYSSFDVVEHWDGMGYGLALMDYETDAVIQPYLDPSDYPTLEFKSYIDGAKSTDGKYYIQLHSGQLEEKYYEQQKQKNK